MFKSFGYIGSNVDDNDSETNFNYLLVDSDFKYNFTIKGDGKPYSRAVIEVIREYIRRGLPVVSNIIDLYLKHSSAQYQLSNGVFYSHKNDLAKLIDKTAPELEYGTKYHPCIERRLRRKLK